MHIIKRISIEKFRAFQDVNIPLDRNIVAIAGQNGAMKTTLLGLLAQPFSLAKKDHPMYHAKTIEGMNFKSDLREKFKFSPTFDTIGSHIWTLEINKEIYPKGAFTCISIDRNSGKKYDIRFWSSDRSRKAGTGYVQCPVVFLSLKRLLPLGEVDNIKDVPLNLSQEDIEFFKDNHNKILITQEPITDVHHLSGRDKSSLGPDTKYTDSLTISAGQDNVGKILLAVLSFIKLQKDFPEHYKGGMIFIDEIEATLYPAAQIKLLEFMFKAASKHQLQFFFTTHSETVLKFLKTSKYQPEAAVVYLSKVSNRIQVNMDLSWKAIESHLTVGFSEEASNSPKRIKVYAEDEETILFLQKLLPQNIKNLVEIQKGVSLSSTQYKSLLNASVPEFLDAIILLDGDMSNNSQFPKSFLLKHPNIVFLPGEKAPEKELYDTLFDLSEDDSFWDNTPGSYNKQLCFRDYPTPPKSTEDYKDWFFKQKSFAGRAYYKFISLYISRHSQECEDFLNSFIMAYNAVAQKTGFSPISIPKKEQQPSLPL